MSWTKAFWARWAPTFLGFPAGGFLAMLVIGHVSSLTTALIGGVLAGAVLGSAQWLALRGRLPGAIWWIPATAAGQAVGLAAGSALVGYQTGIEQLAVQGAITGLAIGVLQALVLRRAVAGWQWWALAMPFFWALGWIATTAIGVAVDRQFTNFGAAGAILVTALGGLVLTWVLRNPRAAEPGDPGPAHA